MSVTIHTFSHSLDKHTFSHSLDNSFWLKWKSTYTCSFTPFLTHWTTASDWNGKLHTLAHSHLFSLTGQQLLTEMENYTHLLIHTLSHLLDNSFWLKWKTTYTCSFTPFLTHWTTASDWNGKLHTLAHSHLFSLTGQQLLTEMENYTHLLIHTFSHSLDNSFRLKWKTAYACQQLHYFVFLQLDVQSMESEDTDRGLKDNFIWL